MDGAGTASQALTSGDPWRLDIEEKGTLENLELVAAPEASAPLGPGQVRIAVGAAGLNFRDVLIALGFYPGEASIGGEGAGVVVEVGAEVADLTVGDRVFGLVAHAFGPLAVTDRRDAYTPARRLVARPRARRCRSPRSPPSTACSTSPP